MFPNAGITDETEILVSSPDYLTAVSGIVSSTDRSALNNYVIWTLVREYLPYLPSDYAAELHQYTSELTGTVQIQRAILKFSSAHSISVSHFQSFDLVSLATTFYNKKYSAREFNIYFTLK